MKKIQVTMIRVLKSHNRSFKGVKDLINPDDIILLSDLDKYRKVKKCEIQRKYGGNYDIDLIYREL